MSAKSCNNYVKSGAAVDLLDEARRGTDKKNFYVHTSHIIFLLEVANMAYSTQFGK
jgi:hypothetical protein